MEDHHSKVEPIEPIEPVEPVGRPARRAYHAPVRQDQAQMTRQRILAAARDIFAERGYSATTIEGIAERANVAAPTVYAAFRSKRQVLISIVLMFKDMYDVPARVRELIGEKDPHTLLQKAAAVNRDFTAAAWDILDVLRGASKADSALAELWSELEGYRLQDQRLITAQFAQAGVLKAGLSAERAADVFWSLTSHDLYRLLVVERGWSGDEYEVWLAKALRELLLD